MNPSTASGLATLMRQTRIFMEEAIKAHKDQPPLIAGALISLFNEKYQIDFGYLVDESLASLNDFLLAYPHDQNDIYKKMATSLSRLTTPSSYAVSAQQYIAFLSEHTVEKLYIWDRSICQTRRDANEISKNEVELALDEIEHVVVELNAPAWQVEMIRSRINAVRQQLDQIEILGFVPVFSSFLKLVSTFLGVLNRSTTKEQRTNVFTRMPNWMSVLFTAYLAIGSLSSPIANALQIESWLSDARYVPYLQLFQKSSGDAPHKEPPERLQ